MRALDLFPKKCQNFAYNFGGPMNPIVCGPAASHHLEAYEKCPFLGPSQNDSLSISKGGAGSLSSNQMAQVTGCPVRTEVLVQSYRPTVA